MKLRAHQLRSLVESLFSEGRWRCRASRKFNVPEIEVEAVSERDAAIEASDRWRKSHGVRVDPGSIDCERVTQPTAHVSAVRRTTADAMLEDLNTDNSDAHATHDALLPWLPALNSPTFDWRVGPVTDEEQDQYEILRDTERTIAIICRGEEDLDTELAILEDTENTLKSIGIDEDLRGALRDTLIKRQKADGRMP